ncbi:serine/arginine repetitive matrix protein 1-like [Bombyx mandarina]|uniref:Serine/arginine repetitive matrix protein 1-like n=1 Tax=Bombyx mandarina TaxID=7092 RepID=A0A6J2KQ32_BOMMA|nr:serine/arginine repetitive matrix protein 1-like [Bombyx mandarina]
MADPKRMRSEPEGTPFRSLVAMSPVASWQLQGKALQRGEGTTLGGESLRASTLVGARSPAYSGGGKACQDEGGCVTGSGKPVEQRYASADLTPSGLVSDSEAAGSKETTAKKIRRKRKSQRVSSREGGGEPASSSGADAPPEKVLVVSDAASAAEDMPPPKERPARRRGAPSPAQSSASMSVASLDGRTTEEEDGGLQDPALVIDRAMRTVKSYAANGTKTKAAGRKLREVVSQVSKVLPSVASANDQVVQLMAENSRLRALLQAQQQPGDEAAASRRAAASTPSPALPRATELRTPPAPVPAATSCITGAPRSHRSPALTGDGWPVLPPPRAAEQRPRLPSPRTREMTVTKRQQALVGPRELAGKFSLDEVISRTVQVVLERLDGRLAALEAQLIAPADAWRPAYAAVSDTPAARPAPVRAPATKLGPGRDRTKRGGGANAKRPSQAPQPRPLSPPPSNMDEGWNVVARRGNKKVPLTAPQVGGAPAATAAQAAPQQGRAPVAAKNKNKNKNKKTKKPPRAPRSAAVVLTLLPAAKAKGMTYGDVIARARAAVDLDEIGAGEGLRCRQTANGAKLLECPVADSPGIAERLAARLRMVLPEEEVRVHRPVKMAELRVTGLDDCTTRDEVAAAVAAQGNCAPQNITVGELRSGYTGAGSVWVRCPVEAAVALAAPPPGRPSGDPGRLRVGWIAAHVRLLEPRAWRCLRCFSTGHCLARCVSAVDRSGLCFRCGQPGHKAAVCLAAPHCSLCAAAGRKADHRTGGKACPPAGKNAIRNWRRQAKRRQKKRSAGGAPADTLAPAEAFEPDSGDNRVGEGAMDVVQP